MFFGSWKGFFTPHVLLLSDTSNLEKVILKDRKKMKRDTVLFVCSDGSVVLNQKGGGVPAIGTF